MGRKSKVSTALNALLMYKIRNILYSNWIIESLFTQSLNDKSLQVTEIHDLNKKKANI